MTWICELKHIEMHKNSKQAHDSHGTFDQINQGVLAQFLNYQQPASKPMQKFKKEQPVSI